MVSETGFEQKVNIGFLLSHNLLLILQLYSVVTEYARLSRFCRNIDGHEIIFVFKDFRWS